MKSHTITVGDLTEVELLAGALEYNPLVESGITGDTYRHSNKLLRKNKARLCEGCDQYIAKGATALDWHWCRTLRPKNGDTPHMVHQSAQWCMACIQAMALSFYRKDRTFADRLKQYESGQFCWLTSKQYHLDKAAREQAYADKHKERS